MKFFRPIFIVLIWGCFCFLFLQQLEAKAASALRFSIFFDKNEYKTDEPIYINFKLKNTGKKPVYVNKRYYVNSEDSKPEDREVYLRVTGPSGNEVPCKASYDTGFPKTDYFVLLKPKEEAASERKKNLKAYFDLETPGKYNIIAVYQNIYGAEIGIEAFRDKIKSKPVTIKVVE